MISVRFFKTKSSTMKHFFTKKALKSSLKLKVSQAFRLVVFVTKLLAFVNLWFDEKAANIFVQSNR